MRLATVRGDVTEEATNEAMAAAATERFGGLDLAVLNAGVSGRGDIVAIDLETFDRTMAVNLRSAVLGLRACVPAMRERGGGAVVLTASVSAFGGEPDRWPYGAAKAGVVSLTRGMAIDLGRDGIRVNAVCPGPVRTAISAHIHEQDPERYEYYRESIPLSRWGAPDRGRRGDRVPALARGVVRQRRGAAGRRRPERAQRPGTPARHLVTGGRESVSGCAGTRGRPATWTGLASAR